MDQDIKDVEYEEVNTEEKQIRGSALYYSTSQVASLLGIADSKVRYYTKEFDEILHIEISNKQRRYTQKDVEKLRYLVELKEEGMTIRQIQEYCSEVDFESEEGIKIKESNPLSIQNLAKSLLEEQHNQLQEFKKDLVSEIMMEVRNQLGLMQESNDRMRDSIIENVSTTVDEIVTEKLQAHKDELISELKARMDERKTQSEQQEKKSWLSRIFG